MLLTNRTLKTWRNEDGKDEALGALDKTLILIKKQT